MPHEKSEGGLGIEERELTIAPGPLRVDRRIAETLDQGMPVRRGRNDDDGLPESNTRDDELGDRFAEKRLVIVELDEMRSRAHLREQDVPKLRLPRATVPGLSLRQVGRSSDRRLARRSVSRKNHGGLTQLWCFTTDELVDCRRTTGIRFERLAQSKGRAADASRPPASCTNSVVTKTGCEMPR
jgi:hypothetical protein